MTYLDDPIGGYVIYFGGLIGGYVIYPSGVTGQFNGIGKN